MNELARCKFIDAKTSSWWVIQDKVNKYSCGIGLNCLTGKSVLLKIIADKSKRGSIIVTTNLPFSDWTKLFENESLVSAVVDRLDHSKTNS